MPPDCYKVEVLHLLNPHLIWVEVKEYAIISPEEHGIKFEQIGIYGLLPLETTIDLDDDEITVLRCKDWLPACATLMRKYLTDEEEILFTPVHLDRRSSIFDDNVHKFGDLLIQKKNGKTKSLSKLLRTSGFATFDACLFHQYLSEGKINTKLNNVETQLVLAELEKYFINKNVPKKKWEKPIHKHTSVVRVSYELEETLTKTNLDKHNKTMKAILDSKNRDLELCKGIDEPSVGRATTRKGKEKKRSTPVEKKLELLHAFKTKADSKVSDSNEHLQAFEDTKMYLEANASPCAKKISSKTDAHKAQILKKVMSKTAIKKGLKQEKLVNRLLNESKEKNKVAEIEDIKPVNQSNGSFSSLSQTSHSGSEHDIENSSKPNDFVTTDIMEPSILPQNQIMLLMNDGNNVENSPELKEKKNEEIIKNCTTISKPVQNISNKRQNIAMLSLNEKQINRSNEAKTYERQRHSSKGKSTKKLSKPEVYIPTLESGVSLNENKNKPPPRSTSPQPRLAYPPKNENRNQEYEISKRVPDLPNECEVFASRPVSEYTVKKLMNSYKLTGSKHSSMIQDAIRKCKDGTKNNSEAIAALLECRDKIMDEIKELDDPRNMANLNFELSLPQTVPKSKLKRRGKKHNMISAKPKTVFGPPGVDLNSITRVPPVYLYGDKVLHGDGPTAEDTSNRLYSLGNEDSAVFSGVEKTSLASRNEQLLTVFVPNCPTMQNNEVQTLGNENKDTSSSNSSVWERRLKSHKEITKNRRCASLTSETTNKDSSNVDEDCLPKNFVKAKIEVDSDESISVITEKLAIENNKNFIPAASKNDIKLSYIDGEIGVKANPFQNFDLNNSVFVDNLVTPVMMVHSKMNKRFVPTCTYRDINFSAHIRLVLKNLRIERPMMIQSISWNAILRGYSVFMIGSASSGKTMGYLPAVCRLIIDYNQSDSYCDSVGPFCIIVCATSQSVSSIEKLAKMLVGCKEKVLCCYYGHDELAIATSLLNGCDLLICTAPSLVRLLQMPEFGLDLQRLATFVLDDCERLSEVYATELKFCLYQIKEMQKLRVNKELLVQYVIASRIWCDFMEPFAKKVPDTVVCIGAFQECVLYAKVNTMVMYVKKENKLNYLLDFLEDVDPSKRTVVVCDTDEEVDFLNRAIHSYKYFIFASNSKMTVQDLYNLSMLWKEFREPLMAPVLICRDANLYHMNIINANYLVQYSMPSLYSTFCRRFATLIETYPSIFKTDNQIIKIFIMLEENNIEQFPKIVHFAKRCTNNIPDFLDNICANVLAKKDIKKAESFSPLCNTLMSLGDCPDLYNCKSRHTIFKDYDEPKKWMPKSGIVTFKILHYQSATLYSASLIANYDGGTYTKYPTSYSNVSLKMGTHYSNKKNRIFFGIPKLGDICAVALRNNLFSRCQVIKIIDRYSRGNPKTVLVNLLDEQMIEVTTDTCLYHLPEDLKVLDTNVVHIRLGNIQPRDKDVVFSELARDHVKRVTTDLKKGMYMKGKIILTVGNCIFIDTLETCQDLKSLKETVIMYNVRRELLEKHAEVNPDHITKIKALCKKADLEFTLVENKENESLSSFKVMPEISWAYLEEGRFTVDFGNVENPGTLFLRLTKFDECMKTLITDIQKYVTENTAKIEMLNTRDIVLAEYPDDGMYERARIDEIRDDKVNCFFVDQGEWRHVNKDKLIPISDSLITQLPFQAIECRLVGIQPPGDQWTDFASNWLFDKCAEAENAAMKQLFVKYYTKEPAEFTGGHKYGIIIIETHGDVDIILNQTMIDLNLAKELEDEIKLLDLDKLKNEQVLKYDNDDDDDDSWEKLSKFSTNSDTVQKVAPLQPIRSVPLIGTDEDSDDSEKWNINMTDDMAEMFKPFIEKTVRDTKPENKLPAIEYNGPDIIEDINIDSLSKNIEECSREFQRVKINPDSSKELDSDDLSSPEIGHSDSETLVKSTEVLVLDDSQLRKPKLNWRQTKTTIMIKIQLIGVEKYDLKIQDKALTFTAIVNDTNYGFNIDLYGVIDKKNAVHSNKGQYILIKLNKMMPKNWLTLTKDGGIRKWIVYDVDSIDTSSDEENSENDKRHNYNIIKNIYNDVESDSDDEFMDDVTYKPQNYE